MNRKVSICILVIILIVLIIVIFEMAGSRKEIPAPDTQTQMSEETEEPSVSTSTDSVTQYRYIARCVDERLVIFEADGKTIYLETDIKESELSDSIRDQAQKGIGFPSEESMYDFLESYSS